MNNSRPVILQYGDKQYMDLASLRAEVGQEIHGKVVTEFDPAPLGLVTFRVHGTKESWKPAAMIGNPTMQRQDAFEAGLDSPYFWKKGSFQGVEPYGWRGAGNGWNGEGCGFSSVTRGDGTGFLRSLLATSIKSDKGPFDDPTAIRKFSDDPAAIKDVANDGLACLQIASYPPDKTISAEGYGFWSVDLPDDRRCADRPVVVGHGEERQGGQGKRRPVRRWPSSATRPGRTSRANTSSAPTTAGSAVGARMDDGQLQVQAVGRHW